MLVDDARPLMAGVRGGVSGKRKQFVVAVMVPEQELSGREGRN